MMFRVMAAITLCMVITGWAWSEEMPAEPEKKHIPAVYDPNWPAWGGTSIDTVSTTPKTTDPEFARPLSRYVPPEEPQPVKQFTEIPLFDE